MILKLLLYLLHIICRHGTALNLIIYNTDQKSKQNREVSKDKSRSKKSREVWCALAMVTAKVDFLDSHNIAARKGNYAVKRNLKSFNERKQMSIIQICINCWKFLAWRPCVDHTGHWKWTMYESSLLTSYKSNTLCLRRLHKRVLMLLILFPQLYN